MKIMMVKHRGGLFPLFEDDAPVLEKIKRGATVTCEIKSPRNVNHHRLYWALVHTVYRNQEFYKSVEELHQALKLEAGVCDTIRFRDGREVVIPGSIKFSEMDQIDFGFFYDRVCEIVAKHFLPGVDVESLKAEVSDMIGINAKNMTDGTDN